MFSPDFYFVFKITILKMRNLCPTIFHNNSESRGWGKEGGGEGGKGVGGLLKVMDMEVVVSSLWMMACAV